MKVLKINVATTPLATSVSAVEIINEGFSGENGLYSAVTPTEKSKIKLMDLCGDLSIKQDPENLHVTLMYSEASPASKPEIERVKFKAIGKHVTTWTGHDNKTYVVLDMESPEFNAEHQRLTALGAKHSYDSYNPHCSLYCTEGELPKKLIKKIDAINKALAEQPMTLYFDNQFFANLKD